MNWPRLLWPKTASQSVLPGEISAPLPVFVPNFLNSVFFFLLLLHAFEISPSVGAPLAHLHINVN